MLMNAQEQRNLVNKLINIKPLTDTSPPKTFRAYKHLSAGLSAQSRGIKHQKLQDDQQRKS